MHGNRIIAISNDGLKARRTVYIRGNRLDEAMKRASLYLGHGWEIVAAIQLDHDGLDGELISDNFTDIIEGGT